MDFISLIEYVPYVLILGGVVAISWLLEKLVKPVPIVGEPTSWSIKIVSLFGFFIGILLIVTAFVAWSTEAVQVDAGTQYLLFFSGLALFLKPIKDIPWAALFGLAAGVLCAGFVFLFYPLPETVFSVSSIWIYLIIFLIPAMFVYMIFKFIEDILKLIGMFLTLKPVTLILGLLCILQGVLLLLDTSLFTMF